MSAFFHWPNTLTILEGFFYILEFALFFRKLCQECSWEQRFLLGAANFFFYFLIFGCVEFTVFGVVLLLHVLMAAVCAVFLWFFFGLQRQYALFLAVVFVLSRSVWNAQIFTIFFSEKLLSGWVQRVVNFTMRILLLLVMQQWFVRIDRARTIDRRELFVGLFPGCAMFVARVGIYHYCYYLKEALSEEAQNVFLMISVFLAFAVLVSLAASELYFAYIHSREELVQAENQLDLQYQMFTERRRSDEQLKGIYHDMANHLNMLHSLAKDGKIQSYIEEIQAETREAMEDVETGNTTLDLLLRQKARACREAGLVLEAAVRFPPGDFLSQREICTLFANCIDNAMEAAAKEGVEDRTIRVSGSERHGWLVVQIENSFAGSVNWKNGQPTTSKQGGVHGYGLKNMDAVLKAHGGMYSIETKEGRFFLTWMVPVPS